MADETEAEREAAARRALVARVAAFSDEELQEAARLLAERQEAARLEEERREAARLEAERREEEGRAMVLAAQAAAAMVTLHAQAMAVLNIKGLVPVVLDLKSPFYNRWRGLFLNSLERYALADHVLSDDALSDDAAWKRMDAVVLSWLYSTITPDLVEVVMNRDEGPPTARHVWLGLEQQFIGNKATRALHLGAVFRNFSQGDLSIPDYCQRLKSMAAQLADLGEPINDHTLVLTTLRGLNDKFSYMAALIARTKPFPCFADVKTDLELEEINMNVRHSTPSQALVASAPRPPAPQHQQTPFGQPQSGGSRNRTRRGKRGGAAPSSPTPGATNAMRPGPVSQPITGPYGWPHVYNPWTGVFQLWAGPSPPRPQTGSSAQPSTSTQGRPPAPPQAHLAGPHTGLPYGLPPGVPPPGFAYGPQPGPAPSSTTAGPAAPGWVHYPGGLSWDQQALASAFNTTTLQPPPTDIWYMDTGAETHMTSNSGPQNPERDHQVQ